MHLSSKQLFFSGLTLVVAGLLLAATLVSPGARAQSGPASPFDDVPTDAYYHEPVQHLAEMGVFEGTECEDGFCPGQPLLRREMAVWLIRALGEDNDLTDDESRFTDVEDSWYVPYIEQMADLKITVGCRTEPPRFCPDQSVSRGQMAAFLARALDLPPASSAGFTDVDYETNVHAKNIDSLAASEITVGCRTEPLRYCPSRPTSRAHMATFIYRALEWRTAEKNPRIVEDENPGVFLTEENELSRFVKHEIVDKYADEHPWLMETWNYTNRPDFIYDGDSGPQVYLDWDVRNQDAPSLTGVKAVALSTEKEALEYPSTLYEVVHELAHVYTLATDGANSYPAPTGIAHLYFDRLADAKCPPPHPTTLGKELLADALTALFDWHEHPRAESRASYWHFFCQLLVTQEAKEVATSVLEGEMPQWLYDTFQMPDGSLDHRAIWTAVKKVPYYDRFTVVYQLKDAFGGYCSDQSAHQSAFGNSSLKQPWKDGRLLAPRS